jgi:hypothetical protein
MTQQEVNNYLIATGWTYDSQSDEYIPVAGDWRIKTDPEQVTYIYNTTNYKGACRLAFLSGNVDLEDWISFCILDSQTIPD